MSLRSMVMPTSSTSGSTATVAVEVWIRPWLSVAGTRWTRWTPASCLNTANAPRPFAGDGGLPQATSMRSLPDDMSSTLRPRDSA